MNESRRPSRRDFFKASAAAAVGAAAATSLAAAPPVHAAGSDAIKLGLIGCGDRGPGAALQALKADRGAKLIAMADVFAGHVRGARDELKRQLPDQVDVPDDRCYAGFDAWKKVLESGIDAVLIACASRFHPAYLKAAIESGKHVFLEKPHAIDPPGIRIVAEACELAKTKNLCVVSGLHRRYDPAVKEMLKRIHDGAIGEVVSMEVSFMRAPYKICERDPKWTEMEWQFKTWYHFAYLSGDDVPQSLIHTLDIGQGAMGEVPPVSAHGIGGRSASIAPIYGNVFDHHTVVYEYANGVPMYGLLRTQHACHGEVAVKILGTKGRALEGVGPVRIQGAVNWQYQGPNAGGHQQEQTDFMAALRAGKVINNGDYMAKSTLIGIMGQMACYTGKKVGWKEINECSYSYPPSGPVDFSIDPPVKPDAQGIYPVPVPGKSRWA